MATQPQVQSQPQATLAPTSLTICNPDLANALKSLQITLAVELSAIRTLCIILSETHILHWHRSLLPRVYVVFNNGNLKEYVQLYLALALVRDKSLSEVFHIMLRFITESFNLEKLNLKVNAHKA